MFRNSVHPSPIYGQQFVFQENDMVLLQRIKISSLYKGENSGEILKQK